MRNFNWNHGDGRRMEEVVRIQRIHLMQEMNERCVHECLTFEKQVQLKIWEMHRQRIFRHVRRTLRWFDAFRDRARQSWRRLLTEGHLDLTDVEPLLLRFETGRHIWRALTPQARDSLLRWKQMVNYSILRMFRFRQEMRPAFLKWKATVLQCFKKRRSSPVYL